jgi:hypothetical protein
MDVAVIYPSSLAAADECPRTATDVLPTVLPGMWVKCPSLEHSEITIHVGGRWPIVHYTNDRYGMAAWQLPHPTNTQPRGLHYLPSPN